MRKLMIVLKRTRLRNSDKVVQHFKSMGIKYKADFHEFALREKGGHCKFIICSYSHKALS